jgi:hypothetical protein
MVSDEDEAPLLVSEDDNEPGLDEIEDRQQLESKLIRRLDSRMSILVLIYILNYVRNAFIFCL